MQVLFISRWFPYPPDNGSKMRVFGLIKQLSRDHDITLLSFSQWPISKERLMEMKHYCRSVQTVPFNEFKSARLKALFGLLSTRPRSVLDTYSRNMQLLVKEEYEKNAFDVAIASEIDSAPYALLTNRMPRIFENIELSVIYEQFANQCRLVSKIRYGLTWWKLSRYIAQMLRKFQGCTVVSEKERDLVVKIEPHCNVLPVVHNGIDLEANTSEFGVPRTGTLIYSGALTYSANFDAMEFFLHDIFPLVKAQRPNVSLCITGDYNGVPVKRLPLDSCVDLTGYLHDIRPAVARSWGCVIPLRVGGGTRLKIL